MSKSKRAYCLPCLKKYRRRQVPLGACLLCGGSLRWNTPKIVAQVLCRAKRRRGVQPAKPRKPRGPYSVYLASDLWKTIRKRVLARDNHTCQACGNPAEVVHHKSYAQPVMDGLCDDSLVSLCNLCHTRIEFNPGPDGKPVKNRLGKANRKLADLIAARSATIG